MPGAGGGSGEEAQIVSHHGKRRELEKGTSDRPRGTIDQPSPWSHGQEHREVEGSGRRAAEAEAEAWDSLRDPCRHSGST